MRGTSWRLWRRAMDGFSLDEAAGIRQALMGHRDSLSCPRCHSALSVLSSGDGAAEVDVVACLGCRRSVLIHADLATS